MHHHAVKTYYWNKRKNFGDLLTSLLLKRFTQLDSEWAEPHKSQLVMVGSIVEHLPKNYSGVIAGIGKLHEETTFHFPEARVLGVRGHLTLGKKRSNIVIADPALLADELVPLVDKEFHLGLVPHWSDTELEHNPLFLQYNPIIIRVEDDPLKVITQICKCRKIVSSSLHGVILADAFGIPRRVEIAPRMISHPHQEGGVFKWLDYHSSINEKLEIGKTKDINHNRIIDLQHELFDLFEEIDGIFRAA